MAKIKCSICSYQFNIWYVAHWVTHILIWFLALGQGSEVYFTLTTGCLGVALQPSAAHQWPKERTITTHIYMSMHGSTYMHPYVCIPMHTTIADVHAQYSHMHDHILWYAGIHSILHGHMHIYAYIHIGIEQASSHVNTCAYACIHAPLYVCI